MDKIRRKSHNMNISIWAFHLHLCLVKCKYYLWSISHITSVFLSFGSQLKRYSQTELKHMINLNVKWFFHAYLDNSICHNIIGITHMTLLSYCWLHIVLISDSMKNAICRVFMTIRKPGCIHTAARTIIFRIKTPETY